MLNYKIRRVYSGQICQKVLRFYSATESECLIKLRYFNDILHQSPVGKLYSCFVGELFYRAGGRPVRNGGEFVSKLYVCGILGDLTEENGHSSAFVGKALGLWLLKPIVVQQLVERRAAETEIRRSSRDQPESGLEEDQSPRTADESRDRSAE